MVPSDSTQNVPSYSALLRPGNPSASPNASTRAKKVVVATVTEGIQAFSATIVGRAAAGVQVPQPPLPVINTSQPFSASAAFMASSLSAFVDAFIAAMVESGNSL